jgi:outer membrane protein assembly factor BamB
MPSQAVGHKPKRLRGFGGRGILSGPAVTADAVYGGTPDFVTVRLDRRTLDEVWTVDSAGFHVGLPVDDALLVVGGRQAAGVRRTADGRLLWSSKSRFSGGSTWRNYVVLDGDAGIELRHASTGELSRVYDVPGGYTTRMAQLDNTFVVRNGIVCTAVDLLSGEVRWQGPLVADMRRRLGVDDAPAVLRASAGSSPETLIVFFAGATFAMSTHDGSIRWHTPDVWCPDAWPTVYEGRVYAFWGRHLWALDEETGAVIYEAEVPQGLKTYRERPGTVYGGRLAVAHESGLLAIFDTETGALVSQYQAKVPLWRTEEVDGRLLVATGDGTLLVFDESIWRL